MTNEIRFGLVGCGVIGAVHAQAIDRIAGAKIVAVCDIVPERAERQAQVSGADAYVDCQQMFQRGDLDVVTICTPSGTHAEIGIAAARAGKHVLVEKPMDVTLEKADALIAACEDAGVLLGCIFQHRFDPAVVALKEAVAAGKLGRLHFGGSHTKWFRAQSYYDSGDWRGTWALDGGGALINQSIHYVDLLQYVLGPVEELHAYTSTAAHVRMETEDLAVASLKFRSGALGLLEGTTAAYPGFVARLDIYGSEGSVIIENDVISEWKLTCGEECPVPASAGSFIGGSSSHDIWIVGHQRNIEDMIAAVRENRPPKVTGQEGRKALEIVLAVYESARTGKPVQLER